MQNCALWHKFLKRVLLPVPLSDEKEKIQK